MLVLMTGHLEYWAVNLVVMSCLQLIKEPLETPLPSPAPGLGEASWFYRVSLLTQQCWRGVLDNGLLPLISSLHKHHDTNALH